MKINPGTSGLAQSVSSRKYNFLRASFLKTIKPVQMCTCSQNEY